MASLEQKQQQQKQYYGPFHRLKSSTQTNDVAKQQQANQQIWGRPRLYSSIPQVQAYTGLLPEHEQGIEFYTTTPPDSNVSPGQARWTGPRDGVEIVRNEDFAKISCEISKNTQQ